MIDTYSLPSVYNVCDQTLREVIALPKVSMAHVTMEANDASLLHQHSAMTEVYFILQGEGVLYHGERALKAEKGAYLVIPKNTPHQLRNTGNTDLEHLVFAIPPFNPKDVEVLKTPTKETTPEIFSHEKPQVTALDGALIHELMSADERQHLDVALAVGFLPPGRKAIPHHHRISEEIYYVTDGTGKVRVGEKAFEVKKGSAVYVPVNTVHALENGSATEELKVLCVSSPSYTEGDFVLESR